MPQAVIATFDPTADAAIRALRDRVGATSPLPPHLTFAAATDIPARTRAALAAELRVLSMPTVWLSSLATFATTENVLMLGAVTDGELLAVHNALHDVLAGKVKNPNTYYLPGSWVPHVSLLSGVPDADVVRGFEAVFPVRPLRCRVREVSVVDTKGAHEVLHTF
ncbi:2'-5' RNA ligase family protein [Actinokineospora pegani]|uniref:2'-5' RNA ligase family protein n=1 Tax=Actinokineospora pegani TaxID=2654637 RepID=UPI001F34ABBB|nr:2'-5' RNA ligase family protein [Actinokineospora pegani]